MNIATQPWMIRASTQSLIAAFARANAPMRFVGGCVRDALLMRPVTDVDVATPLPPDAVMRLLKADGIKVIPTGITHGTVTAVIEGDHFEITTLRRDTACDGRHAIVEFTDDWQQDAERRDFTMNALYATPAGDVIDEVGGVDDALAGRVIFIGDAAQRIEEDALRILRFFRFHAYYGKAVADTESLAACAAHAEKTDRLSGERIQREMMKLLAAPAPVEALLIMQEAGLLRRLLYAEVEISVLSTLLQLEPSPDALLRLALLLRTSPLKNTLPGQVSARWKLSGAAQERLAQLVQQNMVTVEMDTAAQKKQIRIHGAARFADAVFIFWAESLQQSPMQEKQYADMLGAMLALAQNWTAPTFPVNGNDLIQLGFASDARLGETLSSLQDYWEAQDYAPDKATLLARVQQPT